ncbi:MAG: DUF2461 domain-containing protein [Acidobacteriota bacterium]|nr:DUF2461 domain-containing protein [Acidobacteriota bacterium]
MPKPSYFSEDVFRFLRQLKRNNDREWFAENKERYQKVVVEPALAFIADFAAALGDMAPRFVADARPTRGSLFRIYRDTRFSADKTPYKTHVGISFRHEDGKDVHAPLYYLHLEPKGCFVAAGIWHPDSRTTTRIRTAIAADPRGWKKATARLELDGESLTRPPKGFDPAHPLIEDLKRKDFIVSESLSEEQICSAALLKDATAIWRRMTPLVEFTTRAVGLKF